MKGSCKREEHGNGWGQEMTREQDCVSGRRGSKAISVPAVMEEGKCWVHTRDEVEDRNTVSLRRMSTRRVGVASHPRVRIHLNHSPAV